MSGSRSPAPAEAFTFDEATHTYRLDNKRLAGVTTVLKEAGMVDDAWYTEEGRLRGKHVHAACHYIDEGTLDWEDFRTRLPGLVGYVRGYEKFKAETGFKPIFLVEKPLYHPALKFAGTPDRFGINGQGVLWLPDLKTGKPEPWAGIQTAAYEELIRTNYVMETTGHHIVRLAVELREEGDYRTHWFKDRYDWAVFQSAYNVANWKAQHQNGGRYVD